jgi:S-adenosylmethionine:tRNA ribosyltransferase-isomerase
VDVSDFDFELPAELIAQRPAERRTEARLMVLPREGGVVHTTVAALPDLLERGDLLVVNNTRVFPARLLGRRVPSGGVVECLLVRKTGESGDGEVWEALMHPGQKLKPGAAVVFEGEPALHLEVRERHFFGRRLVRLWTSDGSPVERAVDALGRVPLPPYIKRADTAEDRERYQTVFADRRGSVAAPTAGLHFTPELLGELAARGIERVEITLHVGYGTFQPVRVERVEDHRIEPEHYDISTGAAQAINRALDERRRIVAVGTTTVRTLEAVALANNGRIVSGGGEAGVFIYPGFRFRVVGALMTNFHLPASSLLMLVAAFAGRERVLDAYREAIAARYRFYSYGDAMLILRQ